jgi:hypothetical protein
MSRPCVGPRAAATLADAIVGFVVMVPSLVGAVAAWSSGEPPQRVGDRVAGTIVMYR